MRPLTWLSTKIGLFRAPPKSPEHPPKSPEQYDVEFIFIYPYISPHSGLSDSAIPSTPSVDPTPVSADPPNVAATFDNPETSTADSTVSAGTSNAALQDADPLTVSTSTIRVDDNDSAATLPPVSAGTSNAVASGYTPVSTSLSASTSTHFPSTTRLLRALWFALLADPNEYLIKQYHTVFYRICDDLYRKPNQNRQKVQELMNTPAVRDFLTQPDGFQICVSSAIEKLPPNSWIQELIGSPDLIWGFTNRHKEHEPSLGLFIPVLNWALCSAYEDTFTSEATTEVLERRGCLGSLIAVTLLHETNHSFIRWRLNGVVEDVSEFITPDLVLGKAGESGWEWECGVFRGVLQARWNARDLAEVDRFSRIQDVWLQLASSANDLSPLRPVAARNLVTFHDEILLGNLTHETIVNCFPEEPSLPHSQVTHGNRLLLRGTLPRPGRQMPTPLHIHCGNAMERIEKQSNLRLFVQFLSKFWWG